MAPAIITVLPKPPALCTGCNLRERLLHHLDYWRANPYDIISEPCREKEEGLAPQKSAFTKASLQSE